MAVVVPILTTFNPAGINAAAGALGALGNSLKRMGLQAAAAAVGIKAIGVAVDFVSESITAARDLDRNLFALNTVFGSLNPQMVEFTKNAKNMGISQVDAARTATFLGSVLKQAGFSMSETATETVKLTTLAQDLATTYGYDVSEALTAMTALFRGEYDPIEKFGVALKQNEVNSLLAAKGMGNLTGQALLNAQQQVRLEQLYKRSADAQGAFAAQSNTLYGSQARLNATFENLKASLGERLLPVINEFSNALIPLVENLAPEGDKAFKGLADVMASLEPIIKPLASILGTLTGSVGTLFTALAPLISFLADIVAVALEFIADMLTHVSDGIDDAIKLFNDLGAIVNNQFGNGVMTWIKDFINGSNILRPLIGWLVDRLALIGTDPNRANKASTDRLTGQAMAWQKQQAALIEGATGVTGAGGAGTAAKKATDYVKEFYASLAEENRKQRASLKLKSLGATQGLIESIIGSGEGWFNVYKSIIAGGQAAVANVQALFGKTKDGIAEVAKAAQDAAEAAKKLYEEAVAKYQEEKRIYDERLVAINEFKTALAGLTSTLKPLAFAERQIGRFESAVVGSFDSIKQSLLEALADGKLIDGSINNLQSYADKEFAILSQLARQRDDIRTKYDLASSLISETRSAVVAYANITSMLDQQTSMVTDTIQTMVDGVRLTRTSTREQITQGNNLVDSFKKILEKTVAFGKNLKQLRELGLDKNLYKQIVDAGLEAGGATAAAIIDGGAGTVSELNSLFGQLDAVGADIAETSATVMFNNGVDIVGGLLEGLKSQDAAIMSAAESMASTFASAFNAMLQASIAMPVMPTEPPALGSVTMPTIGNVTSAFDVSNRPDPNRSPQRYAAWLSGIGGIDPIRSPESYARAQTAAGATYNISISAGAITDQGSLPQIVTDALVTANKQGLTGGLTRLLAV